MDGLRLLTFAAGVVAMGWTVATAYVMLSPNLRQSITLLQFVSFYAIVLSHGIIWRELRGELRTRSVQRKQDGDE